MSINKYNSQTGELTSLAGGTRTWVGTKAAYEVEKQAGTLPNDVLVVITDDEEELAQEVIEDDPRAVTSGAVYDALSGVILKLNGGDSVIKVVSMCNGDFIGVFITKTPEIPNNGTWIELGNVQQIKVVSTDTVPIVLASSSKVFHACYLRISNNKLLINNNGSETVPNAWYKGSAVLSAQRS